MQAQTKEMCDICNKNTGKTEDHGGIRTKAGLSVHYFCVLLSEDIPQKGRDSDGILGFLIKDIRAGISKAQKNKCCYCNEIGANVKCKSCPVYFHVLCGVEKKCRFRFIDEFTSYCHLHHNISHKTRHRNEYLCFICLQMMGEYHPITSIMPKCCNSGWMHLNCVKRYALSAGYYLKCVLCCSADFRDEARELSIFVPDRDAVWEMEEGAYAGLHKGYSRCDTEICLCPKGRNHSSWRWNIIVCSTCGSSGTHGLCNIITIGDEKWMCKHCNIVLSKTFESSRNQSFEHSLYFTKSQLKYAEQFSFDTLSQSINNDAIEDNQEEYMHDKSTATDIEPSTSTVQTKNIKSVQANTGVVPKKITYTLYDGAKVIRSVDLQDLIHTVMDPNYVHIESTESIFDDLSQPCMHVKEYSEDMTRHTFYDGKQKGFAKEIIIRKDIERDDIDDIIDTVMGKDLCIAISESDSDSDISNLYKKM